MNKFVFLLHYSEYVLNRDNVLVRININELLMRILYKIFAFLLFINSGSCTVCVLF